MQTGGKTERGGLGMEVRARIAVTSAGEDVVPRTRTCCIDR